MSPELLGKAIPIILGAFALLVVAYLILNKFVNKNTSIYAGIFLILFTQERSEEEVQWEK